MKKTLKNSLLLIAAFLFLGTANAQSGKRDYDAGKNLEIIYRVFQNVNSMYVDTVNVDKITRKAIDAMLEELDPYSEYYTEKDLEAFRIATTGRYGGVGALIRKRDNNSYGIVESVYKGFPMYKAGAIGGDTIIAVDGVDMKKVRVDELSDKMKGQPGSIVKMKMKSLLTGEIKEYNIKREVIQIPPIDYYGFVNETTGYISYNSFSLGSAADLKEAVEKMQATGKLKGLILDLRDNGGGVIDEAVSLVGFFTPRGTKVVEIKGRSNGNNRTYSTSGNPIAPDLPLAVLINSGSASASEIVAGALQDMDRAVVLGTRSFGKGLVQSTREVGNGSMLKLTTAKYYIPSGRSIQAIDYSNRNDDGSVGHVPDSLITEYTTHNGRKVYDGGGIMPDIVITPEFTTIFVASIYARGYFDDFSLDYYKRHRTPPSVDFVLSDDEYDRFCNYIKDKDIEFSSRSEDNLNKFVETAKKEQIYDSVEEYVKEIENVLKHKDREKSLEENKEAIKEVLGSIIVGRYYYDSGRIERMTHTDKLVARAEEVLENPTEYREIVTSRPTQRK